MRFRQVRLKAASQFLRVFPLPSWLFRHIARSIR